MNKILGIALLAGGTVLLVFGFQAKGSLESKVRETFQGSPSSKTTWLLVSGTVCEAAGIGLILLNKK